MLVAVPGFEALLRRGETASRVVLETSEHGCCLAANLVLFRPIVRFQFSGTIIDIHLTARLC
jgi:hypothetical protein